LPGASCDFREFRKPYTSVFEKTGVAQCLPVACSGRFSLVGIARGSQAIILHKAAENGLCTEPREWFQIEGINRNAAVNQGNETWLPSI
jgi:hypothetical protein